MTFRGPFPPQTLCDPMKSKNNTEIKNVPNQAFPERQLSFSKILPSLRSTLCLKFHENTLSWKPAKIHRSLSTFQQKGPSSSHLAAQGVITTTAQQGGSTGASSSPQSPPSPPGLPLLPATWWGRGHGARHPSAVTPWQPASHLTPSVRIFIYTMDTPVRYGQQNLTPSSPSMALHLEGKRILMSFRDKGKKKEKEQEAKLFFPDGKLFCL